MPVPRAGVQEYSPPPEPGATAPAATVLKPVAARVRSIADISDKELSAMDAQIFP
ncbi:MAG: hypothetical protein AAB268_02200 [Elusimicrobiota bacterium]